MAAARRGSVILLEKDGKNKIWYARDNMTMITSVNEGVTNEWSHLPVRS